MNNKNGSSKIPFKQRFNELLKQYDYKGPRRGQFRDAEILQIDPDRILVDLGAKIDAVVPPQELKQTDNEILDNLSEGEIVPVYVLRSSTLLRKPTVSIQRGLEKKDWDRAQILLENKMLVRLKIVGKNRGGLLVQFGRLQGFVPASLVPTVARIPGKRNAERIKESLIGEEIYLKVIDVNPNNNKLIFSAREDQEEIIQKAYEELQAGDIRNGIVVNLVDYGAFIDLLDVDGLLHISELDREEHKHPSKVLSVGEKIAVKVLDVDAEKQRISLSRRALLDVVHEETIDAEPVAEAD